jgi:hypothetical protein
MRPPSNCRTRRTVACVQLSRVQVAATSFRASSFRRPIDVTPRRILKERGLSAKTPATGPRLTVGHRRARLEFAYQYVNWGDNEWKNVLFTDKSRFNPRSPDGCEKVWRRPEERYSQWCISPRSGYNGGSIMI